MINIDRSKCVKMLVWDDGENVSDLTTKADSRIVIAGIGGRFLVVNDRSEEDFESGSDSFGVVYFDHAKPLPEPEPPKEMTNFNAMHWAGIRKVYRYKTANNSAIIRDISFIDNMDNLKRHEHNELIRVNGETKLKYDTWKPFTFECCDMGEG